MTLKKIKKSGQAVFEYFLLTLVVVGLVLAFGSSALFINTKTHCQNAFNQAVNQILE